jgi:hypothetical protein
MNKNRGKCGFVVVMSTSGFLPTTTMQGPHVCSASWVVVVVGICRFSTNQAWIVPHRDPRYFRISLLGARSTRQCAALLSLQGSAEVSGRCSAEHAMGAILCDTAFDLLASPSQGIHVLLVPALRS